MKRLFLAMAACTALWAAACSTGSSIPPPPPPVGPFSKADLNGQYAFSMSGSTLAGNFARVGTFTADGQGGITGGLEDANFPGVVNTQIPFTGGTYTINGDGRGKMTIFVGANQLNFSITMVSPSNGYMVDVSTSNAETGSGNFVKQDAGAFSLPNISGSYTFDFAGISPDGSGNPISIIGEFAANGAGQLTSGQEDAVELNSVFAGKTAIAGTSFIFDNANPSTGRGTVKISGFNYVFYIVNRNQIKFMGADVLGELLGDAVSQQPAIPANVSAINGDFVFIVGGASVNGTFARAGRFTANGNGALSAIFLDNNNSGTLIAVPPSGAISGLTGTYTIDSDNSGRGTLTFQDTISGTGTYTFAFYLISQTQAVFQDQSLIGAIGNVAPLVADGSLSAQTGAPFTATNLAPKFVFSISGISSNGQTFQTAEEDFVGQVALSNLNFTGTVDFNEFAAGLIFLDIPVNGSIALTGNGSGPNSQVFNLQPPATNKINYVVFIANPQTLYVLGSDSNRVVSGVYSAQSK
jgi:hypothetical protein